MTLLTLRKLANALFNAFFHYELNVLHIFFVDASLFHCP